MRVFVLAALVAAAVARSNDGYSSISQSEDGQGGYRYEYDITDWDTNRKRWEQTDADNNRRGGYQIVDVDGIVRQVEYQADKDGFRATIKTNEPGTQPGEIGGGIISNDVGDIIQSTRGVLQNTGHVQKQKKLGNYPDNIPAAPIRPVAPGAHVVKHHAAEGPHFDAVGPVGPSYDEDSGPGYGRPRGGGSTSFARPQSGGHSGPTFGSHGGRGPVGPSFTATQGDGPVGPTFVSQGGKGPVGPSFTATQGDGPVGPTFVSHGGKGPIGPTFTATQGDGPVGPTFVSHGGKGPVGPTFTATEGDGPVGPTFTSHGGRGPTGPSFTSHGPTEPSRPSFTPLRPQRPTQVTSHRTPSRPSIEGPSYTGPIRRPQKPVHDPSQQFEVPDVPLTPSRVPSYTPEKDLPWDGPTVPPPASRQRVAYQPDGRASSASNLRPIVVPFRSTRSSKAQHRGFSWTEGSQLHQASW